MQRRYDLLVAQVQAQGEAAQAHAAHKTAEAKQAENEAKAKYANSLAALDVYDRRLRDAYARAGRVPKPTNAEPRPHVSTESGGLSAAELRLKQADLEIEIAQLERLAEAAPQIVLWKDYGASVENWKATLNR